MSDRSVTLAPGGLTCALCGKATRSVYAAPGDSKARMCAACFFGPPPTTAPSREDRNA